MSSPEVLSALASLLEIAFVGRVLLAFLPPGLPGRHGPADLPATWSASHVLGSVAIGLEVHLLTIANLHVHRVALLLPWLLLATVRWITLPGAMVPRHEALSERGAPLARVLFLAAPLAVVTGAVLGDVGFDREGAVLLADSLALLATASFGVWAARRAPLGRATCILALALLLAAALAFGHGLSVHLALLTGSGAAWMVPWLRRGDRRAGALAVVAFAGTALLGPREALLGATGLFALLLHTPSVSRKEVAVFGSAVFAICAAAGWLAMGGRDAPSPFPTRTSAAVAVVVAFALSARKRLADARARRREPPASNADPVDSARPQSEAIRDATFLGLFVLASRGELAAPSMLLSVLLPLAPMIAVELGLLLSPPERPLAGSRQSGAADRAAASLRR